jgi:hypothetical protein
MNLDLSTKEAGVVATMLEAGNAVLPAFMEKLLQSAPDSFDDARYGAVAFAIRRQRNQGEAVHAMSVAGRLELPDATGLISGLQTTALTLDLADMEAKELWGVYQARWIRRLVDDVLKELEANPGKAPEIAGRALVAFQHVIGSMPGARKLSIRQPDEILAMQFDDTDKLLGDRLWAKGQPMTILGAGGTGKSRLLLQLAGAMITGRDFIGLETGGAGLPWLVLQNENSNRRLKEDLDALKNWAGDDWPLVNKSLYVHTLETDEDGIVSLADFENQKAIGDIIAEIKPGIIGFDPLGEFGIGDLNQDTDMRDSLRTITRLCKKGNPNRALAVLHHALTGKAGAVKATGYDRASFGRNSKVLQAWTRGQMNVAAVNPDNNDALVIACGKSSNGKEFPTFAVNLNPKTMIYEVAQDFDLESWQSSVSGKPAGPIMTPSRIRELCPKSGAAKKDLAKVIRDDCGCTYQSAYRYIRNCREITQDKINEKYYPK